MAATRIPGRTPPPTSGYKMGASGFATNKQGSVNPNDPAVAQALAASSAANPNAAGANGSNFAGNMPQAQSATPDPYDITGDPILAKIQAITATARTNAQASALAAKNQLAVALGDANGITTDAAYADAAKGNPFSTLAQLERGYNDTVHQHDETLNKQNLFYSGARANTLANDAQAYQGQQYGARQSALGQVGSIDSQLAAALSGADSQDITGIQDAGSRASQRATTYGYDPGQVTNTAVTNTKPPPVAGASTPGYGTTPAALGTRAATGIAAALARQPKFPNAYLTSAGKRG